jgi:hypothetical protein
LLDSKNTALADHVFDHYFHGINNRSQHLTVQRSDSSI